MTGLTVVDILSDLRRPVNLLPQIARIACFDIGNMFFTIISIVNYFLPMIWKFIFPRSMPFGFIFPPRIAPYVSFMRPMMNTNLTAPCSHCVITTDTFATNILLSLLTFVIYKCEFHINRILSYTQKIKHSATRQPFA